MTSSPTRGGQSPGRLKVLVLILIAVSLLPFAPFVIYSLGGFVVAYLVLLVTAAYLAVRHLLRARFRFNVANLLIATLLVSIFLAPACNVIRQTYRKRSMVTEIEGAGGRVVWSRPPNGLSRLERWIGKGLLTRVERVIFHTEYETGFSLDRIGDFPALHDLCLQNSTLGDDDLVSIRRCDALKSLSLGRETTDEGLKYIADLKGLRALKINGTKITDDGIAQLASLTNIERLCMDAHQISRVSSEYLAHLPRLKGIYVEAMNADDTALLRMTECSRIDRLVLNGAPITDDGMAHLRKMPQLVSLSLRDTTVSDACLDHLKTLRNLRWLKIRGTKITPNTKRELERFLPNCRID